MPSPSTDAAALVAAEAALEALAHHDVAGLPGAHLAQRLLRIQRLTHVLQSALLTTTAAFDASGAWERDGAVGAVGWIRARAQLPAGVARAQVRDARVLRDHLPIASAALAQGAISLAHVKVLTAVCEKNEHRRLTIQQAEPVLVEAARSVDPTAFRQVVTRWTCAVDPASALHDEVSLHAARYLSVSSTFGGMVAVDGLLDPEGGAVLLEALRGLTAVSRTRGDSSNPRQARADALVELARFGLDHGDMPQVGGQRPHVSVSIPIAVVMGAATGGAEFAGGTPISAEAAWRHLCDASLVPVLTDDAGQVLDVGRSRRTIPPSLRRAIVHRDRCCVFAGCDRPPDWCDVHHLVGWAAGGTTSLENCVLLCRRHHRALHEQGFGLQGRAGPDMRTRRPDGTTVDARPQWPPQAVG